MWGWVIVPIVVYVVSILLRHLYDHVTKRHLWTYRSPFSRTCDRCGRNEDEHRPVFGHDYWEVMYPLPHSPEKCDNKDLEDL